MTDEHKAVRQKHDRGYKLLLSSKHIFLEMVRSFIKRGWAQEIDEASLIKVDKSYILPDFRGKEADLVYRMKLKDRDVIFYILIELQSTVDSLMPWRLLLYQVEIWRQVMREHASGVRERSGFKLPVIVPMVLYNGNQPWTAPLYFREMLAGEELFEEEALVNFSYFLLDVQRYTPEDLENLANVIGSVFLIEQHSHSKIDELIELFRKLAPTIDNLPEEQREQFAIWFEQILRRLAKTKDKEDEIRRIVTEIHRKGMSTVISNFEKNLEWLEEQAVLRGIEKGIEQGIERGIEQGIERGIEQGIQKGIQKGIEKGREVGREEALESTAVNMMREGIELPLIVKVTGLSEERLLQLKKRV